MDTYSGSDLKMGGSINHHSRFAGIPVGLFCSLGADWLQHRYMRYVTGHQGVSEGMDAEIAEKVAARRKTAVLTQGRFAEQFCAGIPTELDNCSTDI